MATLIVGAELLCSATIAISTGDEGLLDLSTVLEDSYGSAAGTVFLVGLWAAAMSSPVGVWNGVSLMFADFVGHVRGLGADNHDSRAGGKYHNAYLPWLTLPSIALILMGQPVYLTLAYGVIGAFFMPFLAVTLLRILNTDRIPREWRHKLPANLALVLCALAFGALAVKEIRKAFLAL